MNIHIFITFFLFFALFSLLLQLPIGKTFFGSRRNVAISTFVLVLLQLISAFLYKQQALDVFLFSSAGSYLLQRIDFYWIDSDHTQYPFFPFLIFLFAGLDWLTETFSFLTFWFLIKVVLVLPLLFLAYWIKTMTKNTVEGRKKYLEVIGSPITYGILFFHGQIDVILIAFFVLSMSVWEKNKKSASNTILSALLYAASIASKTWSILFVPLILWYEKREKYIYSLIFLVGIFLFLNIFGYTRFVFGSSISTVLPAILKPGGQIGNWGITLVPLVSQLITQHKLQVYAALVLLGYLLLFRKKMSFWQSITLFLLWLYIIAIHWAVQYIFWALPFLILFKQWLGKKWFLFYHLLATIYVFMVYVDISSEIEIFSKTFVNAFGVALWLLILFIFTRKVKT